MRRSAADDSGRAKTGAVAIERREAAVERRTSVEKAADAPAAPADLAGRIVAAEAQLADARSEVRRLFDELEAREAELAALRSNEQRLRSTLDVLPVGVWFTDESGKMVQGNPAGKRIWGGAHYLTLDQYGELKGWWADTGQRIEPQDWALARAVTRGEISLQEQVEIESFDGERKLIQNSALPIRDGTGKIVGAVMVNEDVTARKQAEDAQRLLAELGRMLGASLDEPPSMVDLARLLVPALADCAAVSLLSPDGKVVETAVAHVDPATEELARDLASRCTLARQPQSGGRAVTQAVVLDGAGDRLVRTRARNQAHLAILLQLNPRSWMEIPIAAHGRVLGVIEIARFDRRRPFDRRETLLIEDMAQRIAVAMDNLRLYHELRETAVRKDDFLAMLGHELRNPLAAVTASLHVLQHTANDGDQARRAEAVITRQVSHLARLVDDLLDMTRISRGTVHLRRERLDLTALVRRTVEDLGPLFEPRSISLKTSLPDESLPVDADPTRLHQVVGNLLQNAIKFSDDGGRVAVSLARAGDDRALLTVEDDGIGIDPSMMENLFAPFSQAERSLARTRGGLGLGLTLVKSLIELHGGTVQASSEGPDRGSCFSVTLPLASADQSAVRRAATTVIRTPPIPRPAEPRPAQLGPRVVHHGRRVLLIEDNADAAHSLREALELGSHQVEIAYGGRDGLRKAQVFRPEVVLCDIGLPDMTGYEVARAFRSDESLRGVVLVALTGYASREDQSQAVQAGFDRHIAKPPSIDTLEEMLSSVGGTGFPPTSTAL